jgi:hypothetical protein
VTLAHINSFTTDNPAKLSRELSDFEDRVSKELDNVRATSVPVPLVSRFVATPTLGIVSAQPGQQLEVDTSQASAVVVLPALIAKNFGRVFLVIKSAAANNLTFVCQDPSVLCNGVAFPVAAAIGVRIFYCSASGYYR